MKVFTIDYRDIPQLALSACAIGYFDGLHLGHQQLIETARKEAALHGLESAVLTFDPDPWKILRPDANLEHLCSLEDKEVILEAMGIDCFYVVRFSKTFAALSIDEFHAFLRAMNIKILICGFDYTYGKMGKGTVASLQKCPYFKTVVIHPVVDHDLKISSSRIEALVRSGEVLEAGKLLGSLYSIKGIIVHGYERGRILGYPTANLLTGPEAILPANGVYAGFVQVKDQLYPAMINVGFNPTFDNDKKTIEAHILDFSQNLYGKPSRFFFANRLRGEKKFTGMEELSAQLAKDKKTTREALLASRSLWAATAKLWSLQPLDDIMQK